MTHRAKQLGSPSRLRLRSCSWPASETTSQASPVSSRSSRRSARGGPPPERGGCAGGRAPRRDAPGFFVARRSSDAQRTLPAGRTRARAGRYERRPHASARWARLVGIGARPAELDRDARRRDSPEGALLSHLRIARPKASRQGADASRDWSRAPHGPRSCRQAPATGRAGPEVRQQRTLQAIAVAERRDRAPPGRAPCDEGGCQRAEHADAAHTCLLEHGFDQPGSVRCASLERRVDEILERLAAAHATSAATRLGWWAAPRRAARASRALTGEA